MNQEQLRVLLQQVRAGALDVEAALDRMRHMPFEDLGFAKIDHHRAGQISGHVHPGVAGILEHKYAGAVSHINHAG